MGVGLSNGGSSGPIFDHNDVVRRLIPGLVLVLAGCSHGSDFLPLRDNSQWTYTVNTGTDTYVEPIKVLRRIPVRGQLGYEIGGNLGISRLTWDDGVLYADSLVNSRFHPALPIFSPTAESLSWAGTIESMGKSQKATATIMLKEDKIEKLRQKITVRRATITIQTPRTIIEVKTWYRPGVGIVKQEQRTGNKLDVAMELLSTP